MILRGIIAERGKNDILVIGPVKNSSIQTGISICAEISSDANRSSGHKDKVRASQMVSGVSGGFGSAFGFVKNPLCGKKHLNGKQCS